MMRDRSVLFVRGAILAVTLWIAMAATPGGAAQAVPDPRFGLVEAFWLPDEAAELQLGWERILFYWREIQPTGPDDWNTLHVREEWLQAAAAEGRQVVGVLKNTPPWATDDISEAGVPRGLYLPLDDPDNYWAVFVRKTARYYGDRGVHHWVIWNEPEIQPGVYGHEFAGDLDDYVRLLEVAYRVMKDEDPAAIIHLAGLTWWHDPGYLDRLLTRLASDPAAAAYNHYFDVISLHIYFRTETVFEIVRAVDRIQQSAGMDKAIWINETNASPNLDPLWPVTRPAFQVDLDQQAWFVVQALALGFAGGADRIAVYKLLDIQLPPGAESFGILRPDQTRRPAFAAYKHAIQRLDGFTGVGLERRPSYDIVTFNRPGEVVRIVWTRFSGDLTVSLPALAGAARAFSASGAALSPVVAEDGVYTLTLGGARCRQGACDIGGPPLFIVETAAQAPGLQAVPTLAATPLPSHTPVLPTLPAATSTPPATMTLLPLPTPATTAALTLPSASATAVAAAVSAPLPSPTAGPQPGAAAETTAVTPQEGISGLVLLGIAGGLALLLLLTVIRQRNRPV